MITERLEVMREQLARYRAQAIVIHARLLELETAGNDNIAAIRRALIESSVRIEGVARALVDTAPARWPRGTEEIEPLGRAVAEADDKWDEVTLRPTGDEWGDAPTLRPEDWPEEPTLRRAR